MKLKNDGLPNIRFCREHGYGTTLIDLRTWDGEGLQASLGMIDEHLIAKMKLVMEDGY